VKERRFSIRNNYEERAALLSNGVIYTSWASHCDINPYNGWIIGYNADTLKQTAVLNFTANGTEGSVWQSGALPAADPQGFIYALAANGTFDTKLNSYGFPERGDFGNSFLKVVGRQGVGERLLHNVQRGGRKCRRR
jgi:hypothetical protein